MTHTGGHLGIRRDAQDVRDGVLDDHGRIEFADVLLHGEQVRFETEEAGPEAAELQQADVHPLPQIDADRRHVPYDLRLGLLEGEVHCPVAAPTGGVAELRRQRRLSRAGPAADKDRAPFVEAAVTEHGVKAGHAGGHPLLRHVVPKAG